MRSAQWRRPALALPAAIDPSCSTISRARHEPIHGTAPRAELWLLLTYNRPLGSKALEESELPHLDIDAAMAVEPGTGRPALREPLYLVCTNGRRDPCCAQLGAPMFQALHSSLGSRVRQSSHVGGHRFAPNVVLFPHGLCYGRIEQDESSEFAHAAQRGQIVLDRLRGRSCYSPVVQAAEVLLRKELGNAELSAYRLRAERQLADNRWNIEFEQPGGGVHLLTVESIVSEERDRVSCWSDKLAPVTSYVLRSHITEDSSS